MADRGEKLPDTSLTGSRGRGMEGGWGEEGGNRAEMEMFVGFETELFDILHFILVHL